MAQSALQNCEICVITPGLYHCQQCDQLFCHSCKIEHLRSNLAKNHIFRTDEEISKESNLYCKQHDELFIFECLQCNAEGCKICALESHNGHKISELSKYHAKLLNVVNEKIKQKLQSIQSNTEKLEKETCSYQQGAATAIRSITDEGDRLKQLIEIMVEDLIERINKYESRQMKLLNKVMEDRKRDGGNLKNIISKCKPFNKPIS